MIEWHTFEEKSPGVNKSILCAYIDHMGVWGYEHRHYKNNDIYDSYWAWTYFEEPDIEKLYPDGEHTAFGG